MYAADKVFDLPCAPAVTEAHVRSKAFQDDPGILLHQLTEYPGDLRRFASAIMGAAKALAGPLAAETRTLQQRVGFAGNELSVLLMRLYEAAHGSDPSLEERCLDHWDLLLKNRVGMTEDRLRALDD